MSYAKYESQNMNITVIQCQWRDNVLNVSVLSHFQWASTSSGLLHNATWRLLLPSFFAFCTLQSTSQAPNFTFLSVWRRSGCSNPVRTLARQTIFGTPFQVPSCIGVSSVDPVVWTPAGLLSCGWRCWEGKGTPLPHWLTHHHCLCASLWLGASRLLHPAPVTTCWPPQGSNGVCRETFPTGGRLCVTSFIMGNRLHIHPPHCLWDQYQGIHDSCRSRSAAAFLHPHRWCLLQFWGLLGSQFFWHVPLDPYNHVWPYQKLFSQRHCSQDLWYSPPWQVCHPIQRWHTHTTSSLISSSTAEYRRYRTNITNTIVEAEHIYF